MATLAITRAGEVEFSGPTKGMAEEAAAEQEPTHFQEVTEALIRSVKMTGQDAEDFRLLRSEIETYEEEE